MGAASCSFLKLEWGRLGELSFVENMLKKFVNLRWTAQGIENTILIFSKSMRHLFASFPVANISSTYCHNSKQDDRMWYCDAVM